MLSTGVVASPAMVTGISAVEPSGDTSPRALGANGEPTRATTSGPNRESLPISAVIRARVAGSVTGPLADVTTTISVSELVIPIQWLIRSLARADSGLVTKPTFVVGRAGEQRGHHGHRRHQKHSPAGERATRPGGREAS